MHIRPRPICFFPTLDLLSSQDRTRKSEPYFHIWLTSEFLYISTVPTKHVFSEPAEKARDVAIAYFQCGHATLSLVERCSEQIT
jgi:hypothetical protein